MDTGSFHSSYCMLKAKPTPLQKVQTIYYFPRRLQWVYVNAGEWIKYILQEGLQQQIRLKPIKRQSILEIQNTWLAKVRANHQIPPDKVVSLFSF